MAFKRLLLLMLLMAVPGLASGEGNLHIGALELHPYLLTKETYSDNVYSTSTDTKHDYFTTITPGLRLQLPFREHLLGAEYNKVFTKYARYEHENTIDHNANAFAAFKFGSLVGLKLLDIYAKGHEPRGSSSTGFIEKYHTNVATASATYKLADVSKIQLDYTKTRWGFESSQFRDRHEGLVSAYIYYRFLPKTSAFVEYDHKKVDFEQATTNLDNKTDSGLFGLLWEITEKSKGTIKAGYLRKNFEVSSNKDFKTWTASADLNHEFSDYTSVKLVGQRIVNETTLQGVRYTTTTGAYGEFIHKLTYKISAVLRGSYGVDKFSDSVAPETKLRRDLTTSGGIGLKYAMRDWIEFTLDYNHKKRNSNIDVNDYHENLYTFAINIAL